ncbi:MAG: molybdenum cofactor biosynthesis protein MoaE [Leucothrix sp.]
MAIQIQVQSEAFDPWQAIAEFQTSHFKDQTSFGATATFVGTMRDVNEGDDVLEMTLEHYPAMTDKQLQGIVAEAEAKWPLLHTLLMHRVGVIKPSDPIVLVAVWSAHRAAAFDACRFLMESLKHQAPFWKKESLTSGDTRWVAKNTPGTSEVDHAL